MRLTGAAKADNIKEFANKICQKIVEYEYYPYSCILNKEGELIAEAGEKVNIDIKDFKFSMQPTNDHMMLTFPISIQSGTWGLLCILKAGEVFEDELSIFKGIAANISSTIGRITSEMELKLILGRYKKLFENAGNAILLMKGDTFIECNKKALELFHATSKDDIIGKRPWQLSPPYQDDNQPSKDKAKEIMEKVYKGRTQNFRWLHKKITGEVFPVEVTLTSFDEYIMAIVRDISKLEEAHELLKIENRKFRDLLDSLPDAVLAVDLEGKVIAWNKEIERMTGTKREEIIGKGNHEYAIPFYGERTPILLDLILKDVPGLKSRYENMKFEGDSTLAEIYLPHLYNGRGAHLYLKASPIYNVKNEIIGAIEIIRDISSLKNVKKRLYESMEKYKTVFENKATPTMIVNDKLEILQVNKRFEEISQYDKKKLIKKNLIELIHPDDIEKMQEFIGKVSEKLRTSHFRLVTRKGNIREITIHSNLLPTKNEILLSFFDLTPLIRSRRKLTGELRINRSLGRLYPRIMSTRVKFEDAMHSILEEALKLTRSNGGFINFKNNITIPINVTEKDKKWILQLISAMGRSFYKNGLRGPHNINNIIYTPLSLDRGFIGCMVLFNKDRGYGNFDLNAVKRLASYCTLAIQHLSYRDKVLENQRRLKTANLIMQASDEYNIEYFLKNTLDIILDNLEFDGGAIYLKGDKKGYKMVYSRNYKTKTLHRTPEDVNFIKGDGESIIQLPLKFQDFDGLIEIARANHILTPDDKNFIKMLHKEIIDSIEKIIVRLELKASLYEKEVLLKEVHHRVKNNLQIIASLLSLQTASCKSEETRAILDDAQSRIRSIAIVHERIYQSESLATINLGEYLEILTKDILSFYKGKSIKLKMDIDDLNVEMDQCIPFGLITNEIVSNSIKHAFPQGEGEIKISLKRENDYAHLKISDNGIGLPEDFGIGKLSSLGLQLVSNLVKQIDGELDIESNGGTSFKITFPIQASQ